MFQGSNEKLKKMLWIPRGILIIIILASIYIDFFSTSFNKSHLVFYLIKVLLFGIYILLTFKIPIWFGVILLFLCFAKYMSFHQPPQGQDIVFILSNFVAGCLFIIFPLFFKSKKIEENQN